MVISVISAKSIVVSKIFTLVNASSFVHLSFMSFLRNNGSVNENVLGVHDIQKINFF